MKKYTVYKHTLPDGKVYIGCTARTPEEIWGEGYNYYKNKRFYEAIMFYGWRNIAHEIIATGLGKEEAFALEHELILQAKSNEPSKGYNVSTGLGKTGCSVHHSKETIAKISKARKGKLTGKDSPIARAVFCVELDMTFDTAVKAQEVTGVNRSHICQVCKGQRKRAGKMHWEYV